MSALLPPDLSAPDGFACPHFRPCLQHELVRYAATVIIAVLVAWATGCAFRWDGLGVRMSVNPPPPPASQPAH